MRESAVGLEGGFSEAPSAYHLAIRKLLEQIAKRNQLLWSLRTEQERTTQQLAKREQALQALETQREEARKHESTIRELQSTLEKRTAWAQRSNEEVGRRDTVIHDLEAQLRTKQGAIAATRQEIESLRLELAVRDKTLCDLQAQAVEAAAARRDIAELRQAVERQAQEGDATRREVVELRAMLRAAQDQLLGRGQAIQTVIDDLNKYLRYQQLIRQVQEVVRTTLPRDATVLVVSKGDGNLLKLDGRHAWHFPQAEDGCYAGYYPADSSAAINHLEALRAKGGEFLLFPSTAFWWLEHYREFGQHLGANHQRIWCDDHLIVYRLSTARWPKRLWWGLARRLAARRPRGARTQHPATAPQRGTPELRPAAKKSAKTHYLEYQQLIRRIREVARIALPLDATVIIVSKGDDELLQLDGRRTWHFPQTRNGKYAGHHPRDSAAAIADLEALRAKGGNYLLFPSTAFWWLDYYQEFHHHLKTQYREVIRHDGVCAIFSLAPQPQALSAERAHVPAPLNDKPSQQTQSTGLVTKGHQAPCSNAQAESYMAMLTTALDKPESDYVPLAEKGFPAQDSAVKLIVFYLPQFHPIPENDAWWGKGFTEWTNTSKAVPQFVDHYQPHLPGELGFYDLRIPEVQRRQVELAKQYGISGFCFYYYWFAGKRLLERPLTQFLSDPEIDFSFCICWANENWTRRWDGEDGQVLMAQNHCEETDAEFIRDIEPILRHKNYLCIDGRPVLIIYRAALLPNPTETVRRWREYCRKAGLGNPYLIVPQVFEKIDPTLIGFDAAMEFPPNTPSYRKEITRELQLLNPKYSGRVYRYTDLVEESLDREQPPYQLFRTVCPAWDNAPRRPGHGTTYAFASPREYAHWLEGACRQTLANPDLAKHLVFVNAWNEWGEGAHLEPDRRYGYAYLQTTADVLSSFPKGMGAWSQEWTILFVSHDACLGGAQLLLLSIIAWLKQHTAIRLKVLCLGTGELLPQFEKFTDTVALSALQERAAAAGEEDISHQLLAFCGATPDLIYGNSVASGRVYAALGKLGVHILTHVHELETSIKRYAGGWMSDVLSRSAHYIACSGAVRDNLVNNHRVSSNAISTVYSSIRADVDFKPYTDHERVLLRRRFGLATDKHLVVGCGIGMPFRKGADLFIEVARRIRRHGRHDVHFYWIGEFSANEHDPHHGAWADHLAALKASEAEPITFLGKIQNPKQYLQLADVFLLPSREDPFPLVALEAAACGLPIICFDQAGGMPEFVGQDAGHVVPFADVESMAQRVMALMDNRRHRSFMGQRAREKLLTRCTVEVTAPHILSACRKVADKNPAVSVIVPNYNHGRYLRQRLESIFNQTFKDFEVILLDDASPDNSMEILEQYGDRADVRILKNERNSGSSFKQWSKGLELARADIWWIAESDDGCEPDFLERLFPVFQNPRVKLSFANSHVIDELGAIKGDYTSTKYLTSLSATKWTQSYRVSAEQEINDGLGIKNTILSASSALFRRFALDLKMRRTLESMRIAGDWYFIIHGIADGEVYYTPRKLNYHRRHSESVIGKLLKQNHVTDFFREASIVHDAIFSMYRLSEDFQAKWEQYLRDQWQAFFPDRSFEQLEDYYPITRARDQMMASLLRPNAVAPTGMERE